MDPRLALISTLVAGGLTATPVAVGLADGQKVTPAVQLAVAARAGCMGDDVEKITTATAVGLAESHGRWDAVGDQTLADSKWGYSWGAWQIRSLRVQKGTGGPRDEDALADPAFQTASMCEISGSGTDWTPWSTFTSHDYLTYWSAAETAAQVALGVHLDAAPGGQAPASDGCEAHGKSYALGAMLDRVWCATVVKAWKAIGRRNPDDEAWKRVDAAVFGDGPTPAPAGPAAPAGGRSAGGVSCPVVAGLQVGDGWGEARTGHTHQGIDVFGDMGSPLVAPFAGVVVEANDDEAAGGLGGRDVVLRRADGAEVYLAHADSVTAAAGQQVTAGQQVGTVGNSGNARGGASHVHVQWYPPGSSSPAPAGATIGAACGSNPDPATP